MIRAPSLPVALLICLGSGVACSLAFPPAELWPLAFIALVPLLWTLEGSRSGRGALLGLAFGMGFFGATLWWILLFGQLAWFALTTVSATAVAIFGAVMPLVRREGRPWLSAIGAAALWTVVDRVRAAWPVGGFTWGQLGVSQVDDRPLLKLAAVTGVWGITFVVFLVNALLARSLLGGGGVRPRLIAILVAGAIILAPGLLPATPPDGRAVSVAVVQVDVRPFRVLPSEGEDAAVAGAIVAQHGTLASDPPDLVVWGESALDPGATRPETFPLVQQAIRSVGAPVLAGSIQPGGDGLQNQALAFDGSGRVVARYAKVHLVPYGEYVPFRDELGWITALRQIPYDLTPGASVHALSLPGLPLIGTPICFENSFDGIDRAMVNEGAGFLVVLTNNASYEMTAASRQHLQMSRMRAAEDARWVVHGAVSGISAFIDPTGRVVAKRGLFDTGILRATIRSSDERTWYARLGDWFPLVALLFCVGLFLAPRRRRAGRGAPAPLPAEPRTLVILPTYDERDTIEIVIERLLDSPARVDVLVVDDSSPDGTAGLAQAWAHEHPDRVRVIVRQAKSGLGSAYLEGFHLALDQGYDLIVEMDSDLSHEPRELPSLLEAARHHHLVVGSRYVPGGSVTNWSRPRLALSRAGNTYARLMLGLPVHDATSGYRVYRADLLRELTAKPFASDGYGFQIELVWRSYRLGYDVGESPITFREREHGVSKISRRIVIEALWLVTIWGVRSRLTG